MRLTERPREFLGTEVSSWSMAGLTEVSQRKASGFTPNRPSPAAASQWPSADHAEQETTSGANFK